MGGTLGKTPQTVDSLLASLVESLAADTGADRAYVFRFGGGAVGQPFGFADNTHEWCRPGVASQQEQLQGVPWEAFPWFLSEILAGRPLLIRSVADLPDEADAERELLAAQDIKSLIASQLLVGIDSQSPMPWGFVGVDRVGAGEPFDPATPARVERTARLISEALDLGARAESERDQLLSIAERANNLESFGFLSAGLVHDLANLLLISTLQAELLVANVSLSDQDRADFHGHALLAERSSGLLRRLVGLVRGKTEHTEVFDLDEALASILPTLRRALEPNLRVESSLAAPRTTIIGSVSTLDRILLNLALNARDAVPSGTLRFATSLRDARHVVLTVEDDGPGLPEEVRARVFEPFVSTKGTKGSGLGLSSVERSTRELGGRVEADRGPLGGARFTMVFPLGLGLQRRAGAHPKVEPIGASRDALVIVDERALAVVLCRTLALSKVAASTTPMASSVASWIKGKKRPLILIDENVARHELGRLRLLLNEESHPLIAVMTSTPFDPPWSQLEAAGVVLLEKPFSRSTLEELVQAHAV